MNEMELVKRAKLTLLNNIEVGDHYVWGNLRCIVPSRGPYLGAWNWDSAFHANTVSRWDPSLAYEQIQIFLDVQCDDGKFPDAIWGWDNTIFSRISKPPVLAWAFVNVYKRCKNLDTLKMAYPKFVKNENFWVTKRCFEGLFHYDCDVKDENYYKHSAFETGWDNSVRFDNGAMNLWTIDLNCYMLLFYQALMFMANELSIPSDYLIWKNKFDALKSKINTVLWDKDNCVYCDFDFVNKKFTNVITPASFMPLYVNITSEERALMLYKIANDKNKFFPTMPTVSFDNPKFDQNDYWRGPVWLNVAFFAIKGLYDYGYKDLAIEFKNNILNMCDFNKDCIYEYYNPITFKGIGAKDFSWSSCFIIELIEEII